MASGPQFPLKTVFAALHLTRMSSVPHLSPLPPNFFNFEFLLYAWFDFLEMPWYLSLHEHIYHVFFLQ